MTDSVFDIALEKRFAESAEITTIDVTSADMLLIRDSATGVVMRMSFATLAAAISSAFSSSFASLIDGKVPASQLPSYVDDVLEYANSAAFPVTGESGKIYVAQDTNKTYRWSGSAYVEISASLALGETSSTAYRGDRGKTAYDHSQITTGNPHGTTKSDLGLGNVDNTSDANKPVSTAQATAINAKEPTIAAGTTAQYWRGDKSWQTLNKSAVGLGNVDNTSDANKPVSTAQQTALDAKAPKASPSFTGIVTLEDAVIKSTKTITIANLNVYVSLPNTDALAGILHLRDNTLGGSAVFFCDPNAGIQLIGTNQIAGLTYIRYDSSQGYILQIQLTTGAVPRTIKYAMLGGQ